MTDEIFRLLFEALKGSIRLLHKPKKAQLSASSAPSGRLMPRKKFRPLSGAFTPHAIPPP